MGITVRTTLLLLSLALVVAGCVYHPMEMAALFFLGVFGFLLFCIIFGIVEWLYMTVRGAIVQRQHARIRAAVPDPKRSAGGRKSAGRPSRTAGPQRTGDTKNIANG
jgi:hypothetical protein